MKRLIIALLLFAALLSSSACRDIFGPRSPDPPRGAVRLDTLPQFYHELWADVEQCSGKTRSIDEITFYVMPNAITFASRDGRSVAGLYLPHYGIVLADLVTDLAPIVAHEMLHAIRRDVGLLHDRTDFIERCGEIVAQSDGGLYG